MVFRKDPESKSQCAYRKNDNQDPKAFGYKWQVSRDAAQVVTKQGTMVEYVPEERQ